ncbi:zinc carboxypeptidase [Leptinotarsa decemlineata]|uniref:zinc carboxypeptidase n=1 Tax=Leptinotarsa decemlineata TaxID=7539 RepID=UPI003D30C7EB
MNLFLFGILICVSYSSTSAGKVRYDNYTLYRLTPKNEREVNLLKNIEESNPSGYDFWTSARSVGTPVEILIPPQSGNALRRISSIFGIHTEVLIENIQEKIDQEAGSLEGSGDFDWTKYHTVEEINQWLESLVDKYPGVVTLIKGGSSYENRDIIGVKVSFSSKNQNKAVWIDSNIHAREWIAGAVNTFILNEILTNKDIRNVSESHDWYIFPVINPDGYSYTFTKDRMWRKTRTPYGKCFGADPNRNWDYRWNTGGAGRDPCGETYPGPKAFSEREISTLSQYISSIASKLKVFISFHSYSQIVLLPYGHTSQHLDNYNVTYPIGVKAAHSLAKRYKTKFDVGTITESVGIATGSSVDWVKGVHHIPVAFGFELRDTGRYGFLLPAKQIIPSGLETLDAILTIVEESDKV